MKAKRLQFILLLGLFLSSLAIYSSAQVDTTAQTLKGRVVVDNGKPDNGTRIWILRQKAVRATLRNTIAAEVLRSHSPRDITLFSSRTSDLSPTPRKSGLSAESLCR